MRIVRFSGSKIDVVNVEDTDIKAQTKALQNLIGGYIEVVQIAEDTVMLVDEDGYCKCLPPNISASMFAGYTLLGTALLVGLAQNKDGELYFTDCPRRFGFV